MTRRVPSSGLFGTASLPDEAESRADEALRAVDFASVDDLLSHDLEALVDHYVIEFGEVELDWDHPTMTDPVPIETSTYRDVLGQHVVVPQVRSTISVPLRGDPLTLTYWSHSGAPMHPLDGTVTPDALQLTWTGKPDVDPLLIKEWLQRHRAEVDRFLANNLRDLAPLNDSMRRRVRAAIERRRANELNRRNLTANLPFPVNRKSSATVPVKAQRKVRLRLQPVSVTSPFEPEPALEQAVYEQILSDCVSQATVLERTPLGGWQEEEIRNLLLAQLNINYTGEVAGELFNGSGKTDILIRQSDRNVFIGECKFYDGPQSVRDAVDQVLSYLVWRDTKAALLLFVRGGAFSDIVSKAVNAVSDHGQCARVVSVDDPHRRSDYLFTRADDPDRAIHVALLPFKFLE